MENLYYILWTNLAIFASFVVFVVTVTVHIVKKKKPTLISCIIIIFCLVGIYLFVPARYLYLGCAFQSPEMLEKSVKLSIIPYEKRLAYLYMSDIYNYDIFHEGRKDGNKAIIYLEKAIAGEYDKYRMETDTLSRLYSLQGNYEKTLELNTILGNKQSLSLRNIYIMDNEYEKALDTFQKEDKSVELFLKADLYKKLGKTKEAKKTQKVANQIYDKNLKSYDDKLKRLEYIDKTKKYMTIEAYKEWLKKQAKEYKFNRKI